MSSEFIQLEGELKLGPVGGPLVDVSRFVTSFKIKRTRESIDDPATWANAEKSSEAGARMTVIEVTFRSSAKAAGMWAELWDALDTDTAELDFSAKQTTDAVGVDNRKYSGTLVVMAIDMGGEAGKSRDQSQTYPVKKGTLDWVTA